MQQTIGILFFVVLCASVHGQNQTKPNASGRIVNGQTVTVENFSFMVSLCVKGFHICGGSIITVKHVVSAAHCLSNRPPIALVTLRAGSIRQPSGYLFAVSSYVIHPNYNPQTFDYDAAVITISASFAGYPNIAVIALQETEIAPTWCYVMGWGYAYPDKRALLADLQYTWLQSTTTESCSKFHGAGRITQQMICAAYKTRDICTGDSGGPLVCNEQLTGIASFTMSDCLGLYPAVFGKIASISIRSFIRQYAGI
uniref:Peptidase S1 domain-containing protein n=1 Tax=Anopheles atroparvus TaxID=41427 RepID=A0AAG5DTU4_ANOAO